MKEAQSISGYIYKDFETNQSHDYLLPAVIAERENVRLQLGERGARLFDLGCGNGSVVRWVVRRSSPLPFTAHQILVGKDFNNVVD